ncbi:MAG: hypothetical protein CM15mP106_8190 [Candidatus Neomarinimicrobiota bacterium]|nr:MAG: hypothetical protein CM15mP106_8190 [Candidatus Neomarinimicrobiota bacterium]
MSKVQESVFTKIRFPRVLLSAFVGASLAISGACLQGLFRNPLADPGLIGVSAGAALGATSFIVLGSNFIQGSVTNLIYYPFHLSAVQHLLYLHYFLLPEGLEKKASRTYCLQE